MAVHGYILIDDKQLLVSMGARKTRRAIKPRTDGGDGIHLTQVQTFLEQRENRWLVDRLRYEETVYVPLKKA